MRKVMLIQPMEGRNELDILKERNMIKDIMESNGCEVINTFFTEEPPENINKDLYYLSKSVMVMAVADLVVLLPNWDKYKGCRLEYECAKTYGKEILEIKTVKD